MNIFHYKRNDYLVIIDYYSRWIEITQFTSLTSACVISRVKTVCTTHDIQDELVTDNGRQFVSNEFTKFAKLWCFAQHTTNPYSPQKNGMAERAVQTAKILLDLDEPEIGLLNYLSCVAPQCNRRIPGSGTNGFSTRHTTARCERTIVATSAPRWGHPKLRSTCQNNVQAMLRSATWCTQITAVTKWRTSVAEIGWGEAVVDIKHCVQK